jgi:hypothetical protein
MARGRRKVRINVIDERISPDASQPKALSKLVPFPVVPQAMPKCLSEEFLNHMNHL